MREVHGGLSNGVLSLAKSFLGGPSFFLKSILPGKSTLPSERALQLSYDTTF